MAVLCYLTDTDESNGALRVLSGSHHRSMPLHAYLPTPHSDEADRLAHDHLSMTDSTGQTTVAVRAGDAIVLDYRLLHGTHTNRTSHRRDCILLSFILDWFGFPDELKAHCTLHPALPSVEERASTASCAYANLLLHYAGTPASLKINRVAPQTFEARI